jgi:hypothetical protein
VHTSAGTAENEVLAVYQARRSSFAPITPTKFVAWFLKKADNFEHVANGLW